MVHESLLARQLSRALARAGLSRQTALLKRQRFQRGRGSPVAEQNRAAEASVQSIYRELESRPVQRGCTGLTQCCQFRLTGRTPQVTRGEALVAARAVRAAGRKELPSRSDGACSLLRENGTCLIYAHRPFGCRTHFCSAAGGSYARHEVLDLIRKLEAVDLQLDGTGPRELPSALAHELPQLV